MARGLNVLQQSMNRMSQVQAESGMVFSEIFNNVEAARQTINQRDLEEQTITAQQNLINSFDENQYDRETFRNTVNDQKDLIENNRSLSRKVRRNLLKNIDAKGFELERQIRSNETNLENKEKFNQYTNDAFNGLMSTYDENPENPLAVEDRYNKELTRIQNSDLDKAGKVNAAGLLYEKFGDIERSIKSNIRISDIANRDSKIKNYVNKTIMEASQNNPQDLDAFNSIIDSTKQQILERDDLTSTEKEEWSNLIDSKVIQPSLNISNAMNTARKEEERETLGYQAKNLQDDILDGAAKNLTVDQEKVQDYIRTLEDLDFSDSRIEEEVKILNQKTTISMYESEVNSLFALNNSLETADDIEDVISQSREMFNEIIDTKDSGIETLQKQELEIKLNSKIQELEARKIELTNADTELNRNIEASFELLAEPLAMNKTLTEDDMTMVDNLRGSIQESGNPEHQEAYNNIMEVRSFSSKSPEERAKIIKGSDPVDIKRLTPLHRQLLEDEKNNIVDFHTTSNTGFNIQPLKIDEETNDFFDHDRIEQRIKNVDKVAQVRGVSNEDVKYLSTQEVKQIEGFFKNENVNAEDKINFLRTFPINDKLLNQVDLGIENDIAGFIIAETKRGKDISIGVLAGSDMDKNIIFNNLPENKVDQNIHGAIKKAFPFIVPNDLEYYKNMILNDVAYNVSAAGSNQEINEDYINEQLEKSIQSVIPKTIKMKNGVLGTGFFGKEVSFLPPHQGHTLDAYESLSQISNLLKNQNDEKRYNPLKGVEKEFTEFKSNGTIIGNIDTILKNVEKGNYIVEPMQYNDKLEKTTQQYYAIKDSSGNLLTTAEDGERPYLFTIPALEPKYSDNRSRSAADYMRKGRISGFVN